MYSCVSVCVCVAFDVCHSLVWWSSLFLFVDDVQTFRIVMQQRAA